MNTWIKLLALAVVLGLALSDEVEDKECKIRSHEWAIRKLKPCVTASVTEQMITELRESTTFATCQNFIKDFCANVPQVVTCITEVKSSLNSCQNRDASVFLSIESDVMENLLTGGCENDGERLANILHRTIMFLARNTETQIPMRRCFEKVQYLLKHVDWREIDISSHTYLSHMQAAKWKRCLKHVEDEGFKVAMEWALNETVNAMKCQHPEEDRLVPCGDIDVSKVKVNDICALEPLNGTDHYEILEYEAIDCHIRVIRMFTGSDNEHELEFLKNEYNSTCRYLRESNQCVLDNSALAETCLSQEEDKQFELYLQSLEDLVERSCVEDGARMANIMHEVFRRAPEHGNALDVCHNTAMEAGKSHQWHAVSSKNMRYYHYVTSYKQCVVEKLHDNNDVSKDVESIINDVLKKMKCINHEDSTVVLCETIHVH